MPKMINLETFANGAFAERTNQALREVLENISDPNTDYKPKRKVTLELTLTTNEDRELSEVNILAKTKLAPRTPVHTKIIIDRNLDGEVLATEFKKQAPGQVVMKVDSETGEIMTTEDNRQEPVSGLQIIK